MWVNSQLVQAAPGGRPSCVYGRPYSGFQRVSYRSASRRASVVLPVDSAPSRQTRFTSDGTARAYAIARAASLLGTPTRGRLESMLYHPAS